MGLSRATPIIVSDSGAKTTFEQVTGTYIILYKCQVMTWHHHFYQSSALPPPPPPHHVLSSSDLSYAISVLV